MFHRLHVLSRKIRRNPGRTLAVLALLALIGAGLGLGVMQGWAAWQYHLAQQAYQQSAFAQSYSHYERVLKIWESRPAIHLEAARAARRAQLLEQAQSHLDRCQELNGGARGITLELQLERFLLRAELGDLDTDGVEETLWRAAKAKEPETPLILEALARGYRRLLRWDAARACLLLLLEREPDNAWALGELGFLLCNGPTPAHGIPYLRKALDRKPDHDEARRTLAQSLLNLDPAEARDHFEHLRRKGDNSSAVLSGLAQACRTLGETEQALRFFDEALAREPEAPQILVERGSLLLAAGKLTQAEADLRKAVAIDPTYGRPYYQLAQVLEQQGGEARQAEARRFLELGKQAEKASERLSDIINLKMSRDSHNPDLHYEVGELLLRGPRKDAGLGWLYRGLKLDPNHQPTHRLLARYYEEKGDEAMAARHRKRIRPEPAKAAAGSPPQS
jgi:predicted Zn-dependent protease